MKIESEFLFSDARTAELLFSDQRNAGSILSLRSLFEFQSLIV